MDNGEIDVLTKEFLSYCSQHKNPNRSDIISLYN